MPDFLLPDTFELMIARAVCGAIQLCALFREHRRVSTI